MIPEIRDIWTRVIKQFLCLGSSKRMYIPRIGSSQWRPLVSKPPKEEVLRKMIFLFGQWPLTFFHVKSKSKRCSPFFFGNHPWLTGFWGVIKGGLGRWVHWFPTSEGKTWDTQIWGTRPGKLTKNYGKSPFYSWEHPLQMAINGHFQ